MAVAVMKAEMRKLGHSTEAKAVKGRVAVAAALEVARANPREVETVGGSNSSEESDSDEEGEAMDGDNVYAVQDIISKRRRGRPPVTEYLIHWKGYGVAHNTWEPTAHVLAMLISEFNASRIGLEEQTENDDSSGISLE